MLKIVERLEGEFEPDDSLTLSFEYRQKSRQPVVLDSGQEAGLFLSRGMILRGGDLLRCDDGRVIRVIAAPEPLSVAQSSDNLLLMRACYHLGNRHVHLEITRDSVRYQQDSVLDGMVCALGLQIKAENLPFEPESGAYGGSTTHHHVH
ncbi:MAG: urease accessory protein UreE [Methylococcales bacterium]